MEENNFGFNVVLLKKDGEHEKFYNITEIHYAYEDGANNLNIAFESDIHGTGVTRVISEVMEFEAKLATRVNEEF